MNKMNKINIIRGRNYNGYSLFHETVRVFLLLYGNQSVVFITVSKIEVGSWFLHVTKNTRKTEFVSF